LKSDFEHIHVQSLAAQLQVHPSAIWWVTRHWQTAAETVNHQNDSAGLEPNRADIQ